MDSEKESELLNKIRVLNEKLEQLGKEDTLKREEGTVNRVLTRSSKSLRAHPPRSTKEQAEVFSLDFINSNKLEEIEAGIRETIRGVELSKAAVCKSLANIDKKRLYKQIGMKSFLQYLEAGRLLLNYKTAKEYAKIGDVLLRHEDKLLSVDFKEENGLKKLMYLDRALERHNDNPKEVFANVKDYSLRDFKAYALEEEAPEDKFLWDRGTVEQEAVVVEDDKIVLYRRNRESEQPKKKVLADCSGLSRTLLENGFDDEEIAAVIGKIETLIAQYTIRAESGRSTDKGS